MAYRLFPFTAEWEPAVSRCNQRLRSSADSRLVPFLLPTQAKPPDVRGPVRTEHWIVADDAGEVHGGCLLEAWPAWAGGKEVEAVNIQAPLSEGITDRVHAGLGIWMIREILRRWPVAWSVGMGSLDAPYARLLKALRWRVDLAPFRFRVLAGRRVLASLPALRNHPRLGLPAKVAAQIPVIPNLATELAHYMRRKGGTSHAGPKAKGSSADWNRVRTRYGFAAERTPEVLRALYPEGERFTTVTQPGATAVLCISQLSGHSHFGDLRVATLAEMLCEPGTQPSLLQTATQAAKRRGAELLLTNLSDPALVSAVDAAGWFEWASNYVVALSPAAAAAVADAPIYVTRGDGDGLLHL
jgi:hypothetical protein